MNKNKGYFIVVDGCDASGKGSSIETVKNFFIDKMGRDESDIITTREPGGTAYGEDIRSLLLNVPSDGRKDLNINAELMLFFASRAQLINEVVEPGLKDNKIIIADRWSSSTYTYQKQRGADPENIMALDKMFCNIQPDLFIYLDVKPEITLQRIQEKREGKMDRTESLDPQFFENIRNGYKEYIKTIDNSITIDSNVELKDMLSNIESELEKSFKSQKVSKKKSKSFSFP